MLLLLATQAFGWQSHCYVNAEDRLCEDGYEKARHGWRTSQDHPPIDQPEHETLFHQALVESGIPPHLNNELLLGHGVSNDSLDGSTFKSIEPVLAAPGAFIERRVTVAEMAQLPDHSYSLVDWVRGNETCPPDAAVEPQLCHKFKSHMGALNSSHFLPQAKNFYAHYHALAVGRAAECKALGDVLPKDVPRLMNSVLACEKQAMLLESIGQHYLQDAWSAGHMWERWGGPERSDFSSLVLGFLIGSYSGTWHGAKAVLDETFFVGWFGPYDDPLCAPAPTGTSVVYKDGVTGDQEEVIGDIFYAKLGTERYSAQRANLFGCSIAGMRAVYAATGQAHGAMNAPSTTADLTRDILGEACWGQRVTNQSLDLGARIHRGEHPNQSDSVGPSYAVGLSVVLDMFAEDEVEFSSIWGRLEATRFRRAAGQVRTELALWAALDPNGIQAATGQLSGISSVGPNSEHVYGTLSDPTDPPSSWVDPALPWTLDGGAEEVALVLAFSDAHAADLCSQSAGEVSSLPVWANTTDSKEEEQATLEICKRLARPLLRVGTEGAHQTDQEPLCHYVKPGADFVYSMHEETMSHEDALEDWCLNPPSMVQNGSFEIVNDTWSWTYDAERVERFADIIAPQGIYMLKLEANPSEGASYAVAEQQLNGEPGISGTPLPAGEYTLTFLQRTITHDSHIYGDLSTCEGHVNPWFVARIDGADGNSLVYESDPSDWCSTMVRFDSRHFFEPEWVEQTVDIQIVDEVDAPSLVFQVGTSYPDRHVVLVDGVRLTRRTAE